MEMRKALKNKWFWGMLLLGCVCGFFSFLYRYSVYLDWQREAGILAEMIDSPYDPDVQANILANSWIGGEVFSLGFALFFFLFPLMATVPYAWSYIQEKRVGYLALVCANASKKGYYCAKAAAVFMGGGLVLAVPQLLNAILVSAVIPNLVPDSLSLSVASFQESMWSGIFFTKPGVFLLLYIALDFVFGGLIALAAYGAGFFIRSQAAAMVLPFGIFLAFRQWSQADHMLAFEVSPFYFLHAMPVVGPVNGMIVAAFAFGLACVGFLGLWKGCRDEVL